MTHVEKASSLASHPTLAPVPVPVPAAVPLHTPLYELHLELGARMVEFAGYHMPIQYPSGLMNEHLHTRQGAGLFDVSHMGQIRVRGAQAGAALERVMPMDVLALAPGHQRYGLLLNEQGGILDDLMFARQAPHGAQNDEQEYLLIVNAACKANDLAHLQQHIGHLCEVQPLPEQALLALQGPQAVAVLSRLVPEVQSLVFMKTCCVQWKNIPLMISRSGYTGEDGFEISVPADAALSLARALLSHPEVKPIGLGARNSLRLEAGLCLYGQDMNAQTTPAQASLNWAIQKVRRAGGARAGGFLGAQRVLAQLAPHTPSDPDAVKRVRVALQALERVPVREQTRLFSTTTRTSAQEPDGIVTSGLLSPCLNQPIALGYVPVEQAAPGTRLYAEVRGKFIPMQVCTSPFVPTRYHRA